MPFGVCKMRSHKGPLGVDAGDRSADFWHTLQAISAKAYIVGITNDSTHERDLITGAVVIVELGCAWALVSVFLRPGECRRGGTADRRCGSGRAGSGLIACAGGPRRSSSRRLACRRWT